jgi:hypothetical protein
MTHFFPITSAGEKEVQATVHTVPSEVHWNNIWRAVSTYGKPRTRGVVQNTINLFTTELSALMSIHKVSSFQ